MKENPVDCNLIPTHEIIKKYDAEVAAYAKKRYVLEAEKKLPIWRRIWRWMKGIKDEAD